MISISALSRPCTHVHMHAGGLERHSQKLHGFCSSPQQLYNPCQLCSTVSVKGHSYYLHPCTYGHTHTRRVKRINLADQSIMWLGAVTKGEHVANTFPVSEGAICGQTQSLIKIHTEPVLLRWVGKMLHQDVVTTRLSPPTGMYLPNTVLPHAWTAQWQAPL